VFFTWDQGIQGKDEKPRLLPSLWDKETSNDLLRYPLARSTDAKNLHEMAKRRLNITAIADWTPRRFVVALVKHLYDTEKKWSTWIDSTYDRGLPMFYNHVLGHKNKSSEWLAYFYFYFACEDEKTSQPGQQLSQK
jgi:hypothetical protein